MVARLRGELVEWRREAAHPLGAGSFYAHQDARCDVVAVTNASGQVVEKRRYDDFGREEVRDVGGAVVAASPSGLEYGFQGRRRDTETGWLYFRARFYDPEVGRFLSRDPVWDASNVGGWYTFVGNGPVSGRDPSGRVGEFPDEISEQMANWDKWKNAEKWVDSDPTTTPEEKAQQKKDNEAKMKLESERISKKWKGDGGEGDSGSTADIGPTWDPDTGLGATGFDVQVSKDRAEPLVPPDVIKRVDETLEDAQGPNDPEEIHCGFRSSLLLLNPDAVGISEGGVAPASGGPLPGIYLPTPPGAYMGAGGAPAGVGVPLPGPGPSPVMPAGNYSSGIGPLQHVRPMNAGGGLSNMGPAPGGVGMGPKESLDGVGAGARSR